MLDLEDLKAKVVYQLEHSSQPTYWQGWWHCLLYLEGKQGFPKERAGRASAEEVERMEGLFSQDYYREEVAP